MNSGKLFSTIFDHDVDKKYHLHMMISHMCQWLIIGILAFVCFGATGQMAHTEHLPLTNKAVDRITTLQPNDAIHTSIRYADRAHIVDLFYVVDTTMRLSGIDQQEWRFIRDDFFELRVDSLQTIKRVSAEKKGLFKTFYKNPAHFLTVETPNFLLKVDPILHLSYGNDSKDDDIVFQNTRGIKLRGSIDDKVYFFTSLLENQRNFLSYIDQEINDINAIPGQGFYKRYQSGVFDGLNGFDYLNAQGFVGVKASQSIDIQLGHGRQFIGDGVRSLLLSDYSNNHFYLKVNTKVWKIHYQNLFTQLDAVSTQDVAGDNLLPSKFMAAHYLDFLISKRLTIGLFESVVFGRENGFEFQYLNPLILYRSIERQQNSPDNVILGLNYKWIPVNGWQLYGQFIIDEFRTSEIFSGNGWWANKIGYQIGGKKFDVFGINHLDFQIEYNKVRPFTYAHRSYGEVEVPIASYSHQNQSLAHPYGANFSELLLDLSYRPAFDWWVNVAFNMAQRGRDPIGENLGSDILEDYRSRIDDFNHSTPQGIVADINMIRTTVSWSPWPNYFFDLTYITRKEMIAERTGQINYLGVGIRANFWEENRFF